MTTCVAIGVDDRSKAANHFREVLGFEPGAEGEGWIEVRSGPMRLFFCADDGTTPTFDLSCPDPDAALEYLRSKGYEHLSSGNGEHYVRDPFGTRFALSRRAS